MKLVIGTTAQERAWILPRWLEAAAALEVPGGWEKEYAFALGKSEDDTLEVVERTAPKPWVIHRMEGPPYAERPAYSYEWLAKMRNKLLEDAFADYFTADAVLIIDSDVILEPTAARKLIEIERAICAPPVRTSENPACLNFLYYDGNGLYSRKQAPEFHQGYPKRFNGDYFQVAVIGCCWFIRRDAWDDGVRFAACDNPRKGEEIGFAELAHKHGHALYVRPDIRSEHYMQQGEPPLVPVHL